MKLLKALEMGKSKNLATAREAVLEIQIHAAELFSKEKVTEELCELYDEYKAFSLLLPNLGKIDECIYKLKTLSEYTRKELIEEAEFVEEYGEYLHMSLMDYRPDTLRKMAIFAS